MEYLVVVLGKIVKVGRNNTIKNRRFIYHFLNQKKEIKKKKEKDRKC